MAAADLLQRASAASGSHHAQPIEPYGLDQPGIDESEVSSRLGEPGQRGTLTVADKAIAKLARAAVLGAPGVAPASHTSNAVSGVLGRDLPRVDVARAGTQVDVEVEVASLWPRSAAAVADAVRAAVTTQLAALADLSTGAVSVAIIKVVRPHASTSERRRVQ